MSVTQPDPINLKPVRKTIRFATPRTIVALILREMSTTYGRSPGGYVWILLEPLLGIALLAAIFSFGFRTPRLGDNFAMYYATGVLPFGMYGDVSGKVATAITYSKALLNYPRVTFVDAIIARIILSSLTQILVTYIILVGIQMIWDTRTSLEIDRAIMAVLMAIALGASVGLINCFLFTMFPLWPRAWSIIMRPLFLLSGVLILYESFPETIQPYLWWNPVLHITGELRGAFYLEYEADYVSYTYVFGVSLVLATLGMVFLRRYHRDMMER